MSGEYTSRIIGAPDGLQLHVRVYGHSAGHLPVICLPGLARTSADFHLLATALAGDAARPRQVFTLDYRGRGRSEYDRDARNYSLAVELGDVLAVRTALGIASAVFVGTSRGGLLTMMLAAARPMALAGAILNDIGPVIETQGLVRIKNYVGKLPAPRNFQDAAEILRRLFGGHFPKLSNEDWAAFAQRTFEERDGRLVPAYDPKLAKALEGVDVDRSVPPLWKEFDALGRVPLMVIRGANSDVLAPAALEAMRERRPDLQVLEVADQGHAPFLAETDTIGRIAAFVASCESAAPQQRKSAPKRFRKVRVSQPANGDAGGDGGIRTLDTP